jgi:hypothetical protein
VDERQQPRIVADDGEHPAADQQDHLVDRRVAGTVEETVAQHDAFDGAAAACLENLRLHRPQRLCPFDDFARCVGGHLRLERRERAADDPARPRFNRGLEEIPGPLSPQSVGGNEIACPADSFFGQRGQLMNDMGRPRGEQDAAQRVGIQRVDDGWSSAHRADFDHLVR